jgi:M6 family metalloprotease-like protein
MEMSLKLNRRNLKQLIATVMISAILAILSATPVLAAPANPEPRTEIQPDGTSLTLHLKGDEFQNWTELGDTGYTVVRNPATRYWEYAEKAGDGSLRGSGVRAEPEARNAPMFIPKRIRPPRNTEHEMHMREMIRDTYQQRQSEARATQSAIPAAAESSAAGQWNPAPVSGEKKLLIILINYANRTLTTTPQSWYTKVFDLTAKSVAKYYKENSLDAISISPVTHTQPGSPAGVVSVTVSDSHPNYGGSYSFATDQTIGNHALQQAASYVNFNSYDTNSDEKLDTSEVVIYFIHAGYETSASSGLTPSVWAHAWWTTGTGLTAGAKNVQRWGLNGELYNSATAMGLGVVAHELGHQFCGLPDLYDTTGTNGALGYFSVMASGSWGADSGETGGYTPTLLDAWSREYLGWAYPTIPADGALNFALPLSSAGAPYKLLKPGISTSEYFLAENRYPSGWDLGLKRQLGSGWAGGMLVQHIDTNIGTPASNNINSYVAGSHQGVVPVQANTASCNMITSACRGHATTLFYAGNNSSWTDATVPSTRYYNGVSSGFTLTGISLPGGTMTATFSDGTPPTVTATSPTSGAGAVPVDTVITATFSRAVAATTINSSTFTLSGGVSGIVAYNPATHTASFTPGSALSPGTVYTASISTGVTGVGGVPMVTAATWSFTTLSPLGISTTGLPNGVTGTVYSQALTASGGSLSYEWSIASGLLPDGLTINAVTGFFNGTPTRAGVFSFILRVTDTFGSVVDKPLAITVNGTPCTNGPVRIAGVVPVQYADFASAYLQAVDNDVIQLQALDFNGDFLLNRDQKITLDGGYNCGYSDHNTTTGLIGTLQVTRGSVEVKNLRLRLNQ